MQMKMSSAGIQMLVALEGIDTTDMAFKTGRDKTGGRVAGTPNKVAQLSRQLASPPDK